LRPLPARPNLARLVAAKTKSPTDRNVALHKKARFQYDILDSVEAGLVLKGTEVKSLRSGQMSLEEAFCRIYDDEVFLVGTHIPEYRCGNVHNHDPYRRRKCLLRRKEIRRLQSQVAQQGLTLVPLRVYWSEKGKAKVEIAICKGRKLHDKRSALKAKEDKKDMQR